MKLSLIAGLLPLLFTLQVYAQKKTLPAFGKVDKSELLLKECSFDPEAEAMILAEDAITTFEFANAGYFRLRSLRRTRIKILKESAFDRANIRIAYYSKGKYENIDKIRAFSYNLDLNGEVVKTEVEKSQIFRQNLNAYISSISFSFPDVKVGSVLEFQYEKTIDNVTELPDWQFQNDIPTLGSHLELTVPEYFGFNSETLVTLPIERDREELEKDSYLRGTPVRYKETRFTYYMWNLPALREEPYTNCLRNFAQRVNFQLSQIVIPGNEPWLAPTTWGVIISKLLENPNFGGQLKKSVGGMDELKAILAKCTGEKQKMTAIHDFIRRNMKWNGAEDIYSESIKKAWEEKKGTNADINLLLLNLLREAKINAFPLLVSTRDHGRVNTAYPNMAQLNKVVVLVMAEGQPYVLNGADEYNPARIIPYDLMGTEGLIVDVENGGWAPLWDAKSTRKNRVVMQATIDAGGLLKGDVIVNSYDYAKNPRVKQWKTDKKAFTQNYFTGVVKNLTVDMLEVNNADNDSLPLEQKLKITLPLSSSGDYKYFNINIFTGLEKNPFTAEKRQTDVDFGFNQYYSVIGNITIPDGYAFEELPKNIRMINPDTSIALTRVMEANQNRVNFRLTIEFNRPAFYAQEYPDFKEFYKKLFANLNEQIVIRRKG